MHGADPLRGRGRFRFRAWCASAILLAAAQPARGAAIAAALSLSLTLTLTLALPASAADPPNVLVVLADDCTYNDLPLYGGRNARTPHLDALAAQGLAFDHAYLCSAMCQPCRAELYTGQFPLRNGCAWNHSASRPGTRSLPHLLQPLGWRSGLAGKVHVLPKPAFPFEHVAGFDPSCTSNPTMPHDLAPLRRFLTRQPGQPFCLVVALVEPHVPWVMGDRAQYPPDRLELPPHLADTPKTRQDYASYLAEITYMDTQLGEILTALREAGHEDDTLVLFSSEQGAQFPGCKWTSWNLGVHTALVARWPGKVPAGRRTSAIVHYADLAPTLLELAGGNPADPAHQFDGTSFAAVLTGTSDRHRSHAFHAHNNIPEGPAYPIRAVTDGSWRYLRNLTPGEIYIERHLMGLQGGGALNNPYWPTWMNAAADDPAAYQLVRRYLRRPAEELYHTAEDPFELHNLADDPRHAATKAALAAELDRWLAAQGDPGIPQDTPAAHRAAKQGKHLHAPPR